MNQLLYLFYIYLIFIVKTIFADKIYLKDTSNSSVGLSVRWDTYSPTVATGLAWIFDNELEWEVCFCRNCLLLTKFYNLPESVNSVYADLTFSSRICSNVPTAPQDCGQSFGVGAHVTNDSREYAKDEQVKKQNRAFVELPTTNQEKDFAVWKETVEFSLLNGKKYIQYIFNGKNACGALKNFTVYYFTCPTLNSLAIFKNTIAPSNKTGDTRVVAGKCVQNSKSLNREIPYLNCLWDGTGNVVGSCVCDKGFTNKSSQCIACGALEFKSSPGNLPCEKCGNNSYASSDRTSCLCLKYSHRKKGEESNYKTPCLEVENINQLHVNIIWIAIAIGIVLICGIVCVGFIIYRKKNQEKRRGDGLLPKNTTESILLKQKPDHWEFPTEKLKLTNTILGSGAFGVVLRGVADGIKKDLDGKVTVAVKTIKDDAFGNEDSLRDLLAEINLMKLVGKHPNVVELLGCCTQSNPVSMIVEYCANGDLQGFLRSSRGIYEEYYRDNYGDTSTNLTSRQLLSFASEIAKGMSHLSSMKVTHRDLAARNILVDHQLVCKVSDFGFARDIYLNDQYMKESTGGRFPVKWMAIESLLDGISTTKSDVWSYGVLLWEIVTLAASPYPGMGAKEVVDFIKDGNRMEKPKHCSEELYKLMHSCWVTNADRRPTFDELVSSVQNMIDQPREADDALYSNVPDSNVTKMLLEKTKDIQLENRQKMTMENSYEIYAPKANDYLIPINDKPVC